MSDEVYTYRYDLVSRDGDRAAVDGTLTPLHFSVVSGTQTPTSKGVVVAERCEAFLTNLCGMIVPSRAQEESLRVQLGLPRLSRPRPSGLLRLMKRVDEQIAARRRRLERASNPLAPHGHLRHARRFRNQRRRP